MHDHVSDPAKGGLILPGERVDDLQLCGMRILQKEKGFRFGMDAVLLADFTRAGEKETVADFGTGTGILPLLLAGRGKGSTFHAFEIQAGMADMALRTMRMNGVDDRIHIHAMPVEEALRVLVPCSVDAVICNPPYGMPGTTLLNPSDTLRLARHQSPEGLDAWLRTAHRLLRGKGRISLIYPAPRMLEVMNALKRTRLEPKRFRLIYPGPDKPANLVMVEAVKDAKPMLHTEPPLIVYHKDGSMTEELRRIYHLDT